jgi:uncharacterized protein (TIGR02594 family)
MRGLSQITRREFLIRNSCLVGALASGLRVVEARENDEYRDFNSGDLPDLRVLGTKPATAAEVEKADDLLNGSPQQKTPIEVMIYLESLQDVNADGEGYKGGWKVRWNPLIVRFFDSTACSGSRCRPSGDITPWCAASLNWVLSRCRYQTTKSASSSSFRKSKGVTESPNAGDIVVFESADKDEANAGRGHVGLFLDQTDVRVQVLGGNQINRFGHHTISRKWINKTTGPLKFHSFHSIAAFR